MNEYIKELKILRGEVTILKNLLSSFRSINLGSLKDYLNIGTTENEEGETIIDEETLGKIPKLIIEELKNRLGVPDGEVPNYINQSFNDRFVIAPEGEELQANGSVIILLKNNHNEILGTLNTNYENLTKLIQDNHTIENAKLDLLLDNRIIVNAIYDKVQDIDTILTKLDSISTDVGAASINAANASTYAQSSFNLISDVNGKTNNIVGTLAGIVAKLESIEETVDTINNNTKPN